MGVNTQSSLPGSPDQGEAISNFQSFLDESKGPRRELNHKALVNGTINSQIPSTVAWEDNEARCRQQDISTRQKPPTTNDHGSPNGSKRSIQTSADTHIANGQAHIAICGIGVRLPNGLRTPQQLWHFLLTKGDARSRVPESRYNVSAFYDPTGKQGTVVTEHGYFMDDDIGTLDTSFFPMPRMELERADPQQRLLLEVTRECLEDAGETKWRGKRIGCYVGSLGEDWCEMFARETQNWGMYRPTGTGDFALSNRVSYEMDFQGPSLTIRTACSASLVALHEACTAIARGDCEGAIVGGVNLIMTPSATMSMTEQNVLSKDGSCMSFSAEANGYARGEAVTAVFIKSLDDALRDGNPVRAVIRGSATNHDGKTPGMSFPSSDAQEALMRRAYQVAGIDNLSQTGYVECHGTGTPIGDPIETKAVARVFGDRGIHIGSIKPNLGHTEGASGLLSVIKTVLALQNATIPPNIKFLTPNPAIPFASGKLTVPIEPTPWPKDRLKRASVNSFGVGGTNAHVILDSAIYYDHKSARTSSSDGPQLLLFSANSPKALSRSIDNYRDYIEKSPGCIPDLAYTLSNRREHLSHRAFAIANQGIMGAASAGIKTGRAPVLVMVFTGQGAQWSQMGLKLLNSSPIFLDTVRRLDNYLQAMSSYIPQWTLEEELRKPNNKARIDAAEFSQPLTTAIQVALLDTLALMDIRPDAVVGHSSGEIAAAYAAGALTAKEAILVAAYRGAAAAAQKRSGAMAAIGMSWQETEKYLVPNVTIACDNSSSSVTISGDTDAVEAVIARIRKSQLNVLARKLQVNKAYHSYHMTEIGEHYHSLIADCVRGRKADKLFFSSVTGGLLEMDLGPRYWQQNMESPVLFRSAVSSILRHEIAESATFLEVGPHSALAGPLRQLFTHEGSKATYAATMIRNRDCAESFLSAVGSLWSLQVPVGLKALAPGGLCLSDLPPYPWDHEDSYWYESRVSKEFRHRKHPHCDLLGSKVPESTDLEPLWRNVFHLDNAPWVRDHKVGNEIVFPFAGYIAMAGKAIHQISGTNEGFRLRHVLVSTALILSDDRPTEIITMLRQHQLTDTLNSQWWEFTITSHNDRGWTRHCTGEVAIHSKVLTSAQTPQPYPRKVVMREWFDKLRRAGLDLGTAFHRLEHITAATATQKATGTVRNKSLETGKYHLHPTAIDAALQLVGIAFTNGWSRKHRTRLPTSCDELTVFRSCMDFTVDATAKFHGSSVVGEVQGVDDGNIVLHISGLKLASIDSLDASTLEDTHAVARQVWAPDIDFLNPNDLIKLSKDCSSLESALEELTDLCLLHAQKSFVGLSLENPHLQSFRQWIDDQLQSVDTSCFEENTTNDTIFESIDALVHRLATTQASSAALVLQSISRNISAIASGRSLSWKTDLASETIDSFYQFIDRYDVSTFIETLAHCKPNLRVLEIGSWKDSPSDSVLKSLTLADGRILCSKYTFMSQNFVPAANKEKACPCLEYITFNLDEDPSEQGFGQYDLIITNNSIHQTRNTESSLKNVRKLLKPSGHLLLQEPCTTSRWINFVFGTHPRWWSQSGQAASPESRSNPAKWYRELLAAGFEKEDLAALGSENSHQPGCATVVRSSILPRQAKQVTLLCGNQGSDVLLSSLERSGYEVVQRTLQDLPPPRHDIIALLDENGPFFENISPHSYNSLQNFLLSLDNSGVFWITRPCQVHCRDPRYAQVIGAARTLRSELLIDFATCEVDSLASSAENVVNVFEKFQNRNRNTDDMLRPDFEYSIYGGLVHVDRLYPFSLTDELLIAEPGDRAMLDIAVPGRLSTLHWARRPTAVDLKPDEVEIEMYSVGLNFRDILIALKVVELDERPLGCEGAGVIRRMGSGVTSLSTGDRVAFIDRKTFSTTHITRAIHCVKIPDGLGFDEASAMFFPYVTAMHSLMSVGCLEKGQSVLIHSACGGVGLAAIQLSQMIGAEIYATVGADDKIEHLVEAYKIPRHRIFSSRDDSFVEGIMRETREGVDVVLNSLSGDLLHATWRCVAPFGKMVEIGKRDLIGYGKLDMNIFLANRSYCCVDIDMFLHKPAIINRLERLTVEFLQKRLITPLRPLKVFDAASTYHAFRYMQPGQHIGRIAVSLRNSPGNTKLGTEIRDRPMELELQSSASYLLVGGLGGLGRSVSRWMVERGARYLIYLSRSAGLDPGDGQFVEEINSMGCRVQLVRGTVTSLEDVTRAIRGAEKPVRGILQMSMVLRDEHFSKMGWDEWNAATAPKVQGTWNLHNASISENLHLDFFVLFSSLSGVIGQPGQANYASANTFLDAFVQHRTNLGLTASAIDIGAVGDVGYISQDQELMQKMTITGFKALKEQEVLDALTVAMAPCDSGKNDLSGCRSRFVDCKRFVLGLESTIPLDSPANRTVWRTDRRMAVYHNGSGSVSNAAAQEVSLKMLINNAKADISILKAEGASEYFAKEVGKKLLSLLLKPEEDLNTSLSLTDIGMDSLVGIELCNWWKQVFGFSVSVLEMLRLGTLEALGEHAVKGLLKEVGATRA
ncbi:hypothetical protein GJ744_009717 [Endocarpon pusillum]|uniref:Carrier domain-containing protein n=1 Tax=Endocarpon pusillum TaxID=364733 RepID=A0A8H7EB03_9EURO|nr:hypothetical protein GJ744_009717 [Endocarpon pusillum]